MATVPSTHARRPRQPGVASPAFSWTFVVLCCWLMAGAYLDSWHHHSLTRPETNFLTPFHAALYSGMAAIGIFLGINVWRNYRRYGTWAELLPDGYGVSLLGTVLFGIGGVLDLLWHSRFGIELSVAALFSPPHLFLMLTGGLIVSGPLRAAMRRGGNRATWPAIISGALTLSMLTFFFQFDQPLIDRWAAGSAVDPRGPYWMEQELGMLGLILYAAAVVGLLVILLRRFELPTGALTVILTINALLVSPVANHTELVTVALVGGAAGDLLLYVLRPSPARPRSFHAFMFAAPASLTAAYFVVLGSTTGVWWEPTIWAGAVPVTGMVGWLVSFIALPGESARARIVQAASL
ncbi:MAG TPA: hypothetical protein VEL12_14455 [Candidatus Nitrosopolaris sp.]|nr:hypothetical protein [Candidatus Nitrosopolaris sp.]